MSSAKWQPFSLSLNVLKLLATKWILTTEHLPGPLKFAPGKILILTHWGRVTHICVGKQTIIGSDNGLSPGRRQAIIWTNAAILLIGTLETNFREILIEIQIFSYKTMGLKVSSAKWRPCCLGLNELNRVHSSFTLYCMLFAICWSQWEIWESWWGSICPID